MVKTIWQQLKGWKGFIVIYLVLLLFSHLFDGNNFGRQSLNDERKVLTVQAVNDDSLLTGRKIQIAYLDQYNGDHTDPPVILMLHGSPVGLSIFRNLIPQLSDTFQVIAPELPGYGASERMVPDYSMRAYSQYAIQLMNELEIEQAQLVGYSLGGGVAINMAHFYPNRVESVTLLSAIGVQELELLGSHTLNHAVHGVQLSLIWMFQNLVPHFGLFDRIPITVPYARNFYDSDQRPIRSYLQNYKKPMLIQHGKNDKLVPFSAAKEHRRIVPHSTLTTYEGGHNIVISKSTEIAEDLNRFLKQVESGSTRTYSDALESRVQDSKKPFNKVAFSEFEGLALILIMLLIAFSTLISEDLTCIGAGLMAARGLIGFWPATAACFMGILLGDMALYLAGRWMGRPAVRKAPFRWFISEGDLEKSSRWFNSKGPAIIFASRFLPGSRLPTYLSAGVAGAGFWMFSFYFLLAAIIWTPLLVGLSMFVGTELIYYFSMYREYALWVFLATVALLFMLAKMIIPAFSYRGRRLLLAKFKRLTNWEFWPPYVLYFPVCCYITYLWARHKSLTVFTAANPAIPDGGFIGESKSGILELFGNTANVAKYRLISHELGADKQREIALNFLASNQLAYPVVVKPDRGQRGEGVAIIKNEKQLVQKLKEAAYDLIIQEYIPGEEYGVFYYRYPDEERGSLFSITTKQMLTVRGDGSRTLEELILDDSRAVCLAEKHLEYHEEKLYSVPENCEEIKLVELGTHARGAIFGDGKHLITEKLTKEIDRISKAADGFYFGRYDIRTPTEADFKAAKNLCILEINGVTSESTNIYDESNSFWNAQKILMEHWKIAFEIGARNVEKGASYSSISGLLKDLINYQRK